MLPDVYQGIAKAPLRKRHFEKIAVDGARRQDHLSTIAKPLAKTEQNAIERGACVCQGIAKGQAAQREKNRQQSRRAGLSPKYRKGSLKETLIRKTLRTNGDAMRGSVSADGAQGGFSTLERQNKIDSDRCGPVFLLSIARGPLRALRKGGNCAEAEGKRRLRRDTLLPKALQKKRRQSMQSWCLPRDRKEARLLKAKE